MMQTSFGNIQTDSRYEIMRSLITDADNKKILDIGAGYMPISKGIKSKETIKMDGVKKYGAEICSNINDGIPVKAKTFNIVIAGEIIEHLLNTHKFVKECSRVLQKKGYIILSTPNLNSLKNRVKVLFGRLPEYCAEPLEDESFERHIVDLNIHSLKRIFKLYGLKIVEFKTNGIISHNKRIFPLWLTPPSFGETIIIKAVKI